MSAKFSPVVAAQQRHIPGFNSLSYIDLEELGVANSPIAVLDDFRVDSPPFSPHPHAGFAAVTYVFEDSAAGVRSRSSSGANLVVGPGGIVWSHAGRGVVHEEVPDVPGHELHGVQIFVNVSAQNKFSDPAVLHLDSADVPEWRDGTGSRVRVVVGRFEDVISPLIPVEPFTLLDVALRGELSFPLPSRHNAVIYMRTGTVAMLAGDSEATVGESHAVAIRTDGEGVTLVALEPSELLILAALEIDEPFVVDGPFIMNDRQQVAAAVERFRTGAMGALEPLPNRRQRSA
jgi:redox-sensitive bicupin YhaK (pirin superfamily)